MNDSDSCDSANESGGWAHDSNNSHDSEHDSSGSARKSNGSEEEYCRSEHASEPEPELAPFDPSLLPSLCNIASFVVNSEEAFTIKKRLNIDEVDGLILLLTSGAEIEYLALCKELPNMGLSMDLGKAIKSSGCISKLYLDYHSKMRKLAPELIRMVTVSASPVLGQLMIERIEIDPESMELLCDAFGELTNLRSLTMRWCSFNSPLIQTSELLALEELELSDCNFVPQGVRMLLGTTGVQNPATVPELNLAGSEAMGKVLQEIGTLIACGNLRKLVMDRDNLRDEGVSIIVDTTLFFRKE